MFDANTNLLAESFGGLYRDAVVKESVPDVIADEEFYPGNGRPSKTNHYRKLFLRPK